MILSVSADGPTIRSAIPTTGLKLWLKADAGVTLVTGKVSAWADQSGNGNNYAQSDGDQQPTFNASSIGGLPAFTNSASTGLISATSPLSAGSDRTMFAVVNGGGSAPSSGGAVAWFKLGAGSEYIWYFWITGGVTYCYGEGTIGDHIDSPPTVFATDNIIEQVSTVGALPIFAANGVSYTTAAANVVSDNGTDASAVCGGLTDANHISQGFVGEIAEIIIYNRVLSAGERTQVRSYLSGKYSI